MTGLYELSKTSDGQFRFVLKVGDNDVVLTSETYRSKDSASKGIASVQANCGTDARFERKHSSNGKEFFNLKAANGEVIGTSQMYPSVHDRDAGIAAVKSNGASKTVKDLAAA